MALQGTIESFGVSEILELVSHQDKTGVLHIHGADGEAKLKFKEGKLVEAWSDKRNPGELIGDMLVRAGLITAVQLQHAIETQRQSLRKIGDILIGIGALRVSEFRDMLELQHRETVYKILKLKRGWFRFAPGPVEIEDGVSVLLNVGSLLMEGFRQIDEWPGLLQKIPSEKQVFAPRADADVRGALRPELSRAFSLVDGAATVREIVDRSRLGEFHGWAALCELFDQGLIAPVRAAKWKRRSPSFEAKSKAIDILAAMMLLFFAAAIFNAVNGKNIELLIHRVEAAMAGAEQEAEVLRQRAEEWRRRVPVVWPQPGENMN